MRGLKLIVLTIFVTLLGCAKPIEHPSDSNSKLATPTALEGIWGLSCQLDGDIKRQLSDKATHSENYIVFKNNRYTKIQRVFAAPTVATEEPCSSGKHLYDLTETANLKLKKHLNNLFTDDDGQWENSDWGTLDLSSKVYGAIPRNGPMVDIWNHTKLCELEGWSLGYSKGLTNKNCFGSRPFRSTATKHAVRYDVDDQSEISIVFGAIPDNSDEPIFDPVYRYKKLANLPFSLKNPDQVNGDLVKGH